MARMFVMLAALLGLATLAFAQGEPFDGSKVYGAEQLAAAGQWASWGKLFTVAKDSWMIPLMAVIVVATPLAFVAHYVLFGPKRFEHGGKFIVRFSSFEMLVHWVATVSFVSIVVSGLFIMFGEYLNGGIVRLMRDVHGIFTIVFAVAVVPMFVLWVKAMSFNKWDLQWMMIMGGYLSKEKKPIPAGKYNAGQKMWFWLSTVGGVVMIVTGYILFNQNYTIDTLRISSVVHTILAYAIVALLFVHVYMTVFAIKGAIDSMINGKQYEDEIKILHSKYYEELQKEGKI